MTQNKKERAYLFRRLTPNDAELFVQVAHEENLPPFMLATFWAENVEEAKTKLSNPHKKLYGLILSVVDEPDHLISVISVESDFNSGAQIEYFVSKEFRGKKFSAISINLLAQELKGQYKYFDFVIPSLADGASIWLQGFIRSELIKMTASDKIYRYTLK